jgi:hypothetical protein
MHMHNILDFHKCTFVDHIDANTSLVPYANLVVAFTIAKKNTTYAKP